MIFDNGWELFLDSGAFSFVDLKKTPPTLEQYASFCHKHRDLFSVIAPLDVIGSTDASATDTFRNYKRLRYDLGVPVQPTYHLFEPDDWLLRNLEEVHRHDGILLLGGMADKTLSRKRLVARLHQLFSRPDITDDEGRPRVRIHGFGVGDEKIVMRFPFYSADAQSWLTVGINGGCKFRINRHGRADFQFVYFSPESAEKGRHPHYSKISDHARGIVNTWLAEYGLTAEQVAASYQYRDVQNAITFQSIEDLGAERYQRQT